MECVKCGERIASTNSYRVSGQANTSRYECPKCGMVYTAISMVIAVEPGYGLGARSLARRLPPAINAVRSAVANALGTKIEG